MLLNNILPGRHLQCYIRFYRIIDFDFSQEQNLIPPIKAYRPRIEHCLQFTPFDCEKVDYAHKKNISYKAAIFGQQTVLSYRRLGNRFLNFQVVFQSGVLHKLFGLPMEELMNTYVDADLLFGYSVNDVNERLAECKNYSEMIEKVETFLTDKICKIQLDLHPINKIAGHLLVSNKANLEWFANESNLCYRQFDRAFKANTGISPKAFQNLVKLDSAYLLKNRNPEKDWMSIALETGFYDYQHLSKMYKNFIGHSPTDFYKLEQTAPERYFGDFEH